MYVQRLKENLPGVEERVAGALARAGRSDAVRVVAVTKGHPLDAIRAAVGLGLRDVGENRVQELDHKRSTLGPELEPELEPVWHLIGHLQRNKVRRALSLADWIHSVDSLRLAREVSSESVRAGVVTRVLVQVNMSGEETKGGFDAATADAGVAEVLQLPGLSCAGLMTMAPLTEDEAVIRRTFAATRQLLERTRAAGLQLGTELSMGMSGDYEIAIEEGSTMIRLGTVLFGERQ